MRCVKPVAPMPLTSSTASCTIAQRSRVGCRACSARVCADSCASLPNGSSPSACGSSRTRQNTTAAAAFSLCGLALMAGKFACGALCDRLGSYRSNYLLFGCFILGYVLCTLAPLRSAALMLASAVFLGFGSSLNTVGISIWAADLSTQERYESVLRQFQAAYGLGGLVMSFLPGAIADLTGSYAPAYALFAALLAFSLFTLQSTYRLARK